MSPLNWAYQVLEILVCLCGVLGALIWGRRHPAVSVFLSLSLICRMFSPTIALLATLPTKQIPASAPWQAIAGGPVALAAWILLFLAIFGWRRTPPESNYDAQPFQFSLGHLLSLVFMVGLFMAVLGLFVPRFLSLPPQARVPLVMAAVAGLLFVPTLICWLVALRLAWTRHKKHPQVSEFVALGIGLQLVVAIVGCFLLAAPAGLKEIWFQFVMPPASLASLVVLIVAALGWRTVAPAHGPYKW